MYEFFYGCKVFVICFISVIVLFSLIELIEDVELKNCYLRMDWWSNGIGKDWFVMKFVVGLVVKDVVKLLRFCIGVIVLLKKVLEL